jgi:adenine-specific DNA-methyltransferase
MPKKSSNKETIKSVDAIRHTDDKRKNIPTIEYRPMVSDDQQSPVPVKYPRNTDLDPQLVWRGKDEQDWSDLVVHAPPLYIQEKVHPKVLIDDLIRMAGDRESAKATDKKSSGKGEYTQLSLFDDFNGVPDGDAKTEFYQHDQHWSNRMILGDSLQVMASLAEREGLRGKVQCIYFDPPYGIKFNSNFQWSTTSRDVKDGNATHITREPEQVKAFRDTWRDGIHSYLTYLRDRLTVARDLLTDSGSIFVQIGDENVHRVRALMDDVFGDGNFVSLVSLQKTSAQTSSVLPTITDYLVWYAKNKSNMKFRSIYRPREPGVDLDYRGILGDDGSRRMLPIDDAVALFNSGKGQLFRFDQVTSQTGGPNSSFDYKFEGKPYRPSGNRGWSTSLPGLGTLSRSGRLVGRDTALAYIRLHNDYPVRPETNIWVDTALSSRSEQKSYVVQTSAKVLVKCILMATDPGDLVLDPTCGSGTTAYVAEQWGRRWITIDTSRVALALARARIMGARYPYYLLADSKEGQVKEAEVTRTAASTKLVLNNIRMGFVYERVPHITLKSIANNAEIDVIWDKWEEKIRPIREELGKKSGEWKDAKNKSRTPEEWEIPREADPKSSLATTHQALLASFWQARIARQKEIDASIAAKAEFEFLYDKPYEDKKKVRVAGPFTVESLSPHRMLGIDENDELIDPTKVKENRGEAQSFAEMILENLRTAGVQQTSKEDRINFISLVPWPGEMVCAEGIYREQDADRRAAIMIGPEFGTVQRSDLVLAAREAGDAGFDVLIACAFNYDAMSTEFKKLGRIPVLKARMNADLHMAEDLKNTGKGNLFVIFGEPDVELVSGEWLVTSGGRMVASYERVKKLSGLGSLEEINRLGRSDLSRFQSISAGGEVWASESDKASDGFDTVEHRRGGRKERNEGVSKLSEHGERLVGGSGDTVDNRSAVGDDQSARSRGSDGSNGGDQPYARWVKEVAAIQELVAGDFPLSLATSHYAQVTVHGVDVFHPNTGEVRSDGPDGIACWFIDTDYNEESFFVRHAYFLGQNDPYTALKTTLKAEVDADAWSSLHSNTSRPFSKPSSGRIAVKVINHLGDEVMKVFRV